MSDTTRFCVIFTIVFTLLFGILMVSKEYEYPCSHKISRLRQHEEWMQQLLIISDKLSHQLEELSQRVSKIEDRREQNVRSR